MVKSQILDKLSNKMVEDSLSESDVVYILSRVRKILEMEESKNIYSVLNFYCNFALHYKIDRVPEKIKNMLIKIKNGGSNPDNYTNSIIDFGDFRQDFEKFIEEHNLPNYIYKRKYGARDFNKLLISIYSDTPIELKLKEEYVITIDASGGILMLPKTN